MFSSAVTAAIFLPGVIAPAAVRYGALVEHLGDTPVHLLDLALYAGDTPPPDYSVETEIAAVLGAADRAGLERFHLYGHSGGGACALALAAAHPERIASLALDEPATDFTDDDRDDPYWNEIADAEALPDAGERMTAFRRLQLAPGVALPPSPPGPPPAWMGKRPAGIATLPSALRRHRVAVDAYRAVRVPVLFTLGSESHPRWLGMRDRLARLFSDFRSVTFEGLHHFDTSHQAQPARTAALLRQLWTVVPRGSAP